MEASVKKFGSNKKNEDASKKEFAFVKQKISSLSDAVSTLS